ncbi:MAG: hypothetical protein KF784_15305 [Fimbriimonadaceae bacterium]|nr:hypothetical protein [Fimbriimonadaceae bacterium]
MSIRTQARPTVGYPLITRASSFIKKAVQSLQGSKIERKVSDEGFFQQYERMFAEVVRLTIPKDY